MIWRGTLSESRGFDASKHNTFLRVQSGTSAGLLLHYTKFIGGIDEESSERAAEHFQSLGLKTKILSSPETAELAKLTETTYFGLMIAWAQEVERYCDRLALDYDEMDRRLPRRNFLTHGTRPRYNEDHVYCLGPLHPA